jgi:hypothetical protein
MLNVGVPLVVIYAVHGVECIVGIYDGNLIYIEWSLELEHIYAAKTVTQ